MEEYRTPAPTAIVSEKLFSVEMIIVVAPWNCFLLEDASAERNYAFGFFFHFLSHFRSVSSPAKADIDILELGCQPTPVAETLSLTCHFLPIVGFVPLFVRQGGIGTATYSTNQMYAINSLNARLAQNNQVCNSRKSMH